MLRERLRSAIGLVAAAFLFVATPLHASADEEVDVALVIAVDISFSMDPEEQALQREGFVEAFRSPIVHDAIRKGTIGKVAVVYAEWAANFEQRVIVPWTVIDNPESAFAFAGRLAAQPTRRGPRTSVSGAIDFGVRLLRESGVEAPRRVIDISGDGANNQGRPVTEARNEAVAQGLTINGLPIMLKRATSYWDVTDLDVYYRDCVIGGPGAFTVPVRDRDQFVNAIKTKILMEIAGLKPVQSLVHRIQAQPRTNCLVGETQWRDRMGN